MVAAVPRASAVEPRQSPILKWVLFTLGELVMLISFVLAWVVVLLGTLSMYSLPGACDYTGGSTNTCNYAFADLSLPAIYIVQGVIFLAVAIVGIIRGRHRRSVWWLPVAGVAGLALCVAMILLLNRIFAFA